MNVMNKKICPIGSDYDVLFLAFVQISELLKNSAAFAVFFYAFTLYVTNRNRFVVWILVLASIGIHSSVIMLLPLFFYKLVNTKMALIVAIVVFLLSLTVDIIDVLMNLLPSGVYFDLLLERFADKDYGSSGTLHYIAIQISMVGTAFYLWFKSKRNETQLLEAVNIIMLYFIVCIVNFYQLTAFCVFYILALAFWLDNDMVFEKVICSKL